MMVSDVRPRLSDDHKVVSEVLKQLVVALDKKDVGTSYAKLDLFWARLAVHIRAEHLYLFPAVTNHLSKSLNGGVPESREALAIVHNLRADHSYFMRELARAIGILRDLPEHILTASNELKLATVGVIVREIEKQLATHNEIEESQIYRWSSTILTGPEQLTLLTQINVELENRPARFSAATWANE